MSINDYWYIELDFSGLYLDIMLFCFTKYPEKYFYQSTL